MDKDIRKPPSLLISAPPNREFLIGCSKKNPGVLSETTGIVRPVKGINYFGYRYQTVYPQIRAYLNWWVPVLAPPVRVKALIREQAF